MGKKDEIFFIAKKNNLYNSFFILLIALITIKYLIGVCT